MERYGAREVQRLDGLSRYCEFSKSAAKEEEGVGVGESGIYVHWRSNAVNTRFYIVP